MAPLATLREFAGRRPGVAAAGLAILSGLLLTLCQPPRGEAWLAPLALAPLLLAAVTLPRPFLAGWLAGAVHFTTLLSWVCTVMTKHGSLAGGLAALLTGLLGAVLGLYVALFSSAVAWCARRRGASFALGAAPFLWVGAEILRARWLTGFPWCPLGNALWAHPNFAWPAALGQVWLLSLLCGAVAGQCAALLGRTARKKILWTHVGVFIALPAAHRFQPPRREGGQPVARSIRIVQPAIPQDRKWDPEYSREVLDRLGRLSFPAGVHGKFPGFTPPRPELILYPESSLPDVESRELNAVLTEISGKTGARLLLGAEYARGDRVYNAAVLLGPPPIPATRPRFPPAGGAPPGLLSPVGTKFALPEEGFYAKRHLAPFGEYVPWRRWLFFAKKLTRGIGDFTPGRGERAIFLPSHPGERSPVGFGVLICYEAIFPELAAESARLPGVSFLLNLSNDAWFDGTGAKLQLLAMARMRALETGLPVIRVANTGYSGVLRPGDMELMKPDRPLAQDFDVSAINTAPTLATKFGRSLSWTYLALGAIPLTLAFAKPAARRAPRTAH